MTITISTECDFQYYNYLNTFLIYFISKSNIMFIIQSLKNIALILICNLAPTINLKHLNYISFGDKFNIIFIKLS